VIQRYFFEPYRFVPPYRGKLWCRVAKRLLPRHLRRSMGVPRCRFRGVERLEESLRNKAGIVLAANHSRWADPVVLGLLGLTVEQYLYYLVSYHLFKQSRLMGWWLNRIGGYSILREGSDRESIRATVQILVEAERPLAMFPEGTWFRQNDRVGPLQEGLGLILRQAAKQAERPIVVHPVGLKYWVLCDPRPELERRLARMERRLGWKPKGQASLLDRILKAGEAMLTIKEIEQFGASQAGSLDDRVGRLAAAKAAALEKFYLGKEHDGATLERVRRVRQVLVRKLQEEAVTGEAGETIREALDELLFCENLTAHSAEYLLERPSLERMTETVQRLEETLSDEKERPVAPLGVDVVVGAAIDAREFQASRGGGRKADPFVERVAVDMQRLLDGLLAEGPPPEWGCPPRVERVAGPSAADAR
jgi:hypothetical protein